MSEEADKANNGRPFFRRWRNAYLAVAVVFVLEVAFFYFFSRYFS